MIEPFSVVIGSAIDIAIEVGVPARLPHWQGGHLDTRIQTLNMIRHGIFAI